MIENAKYFEIVSYQASLFKDSGYFSTFVYLKSKEQIRNSTELVYE